MKPLLVLLAMGACAPAFAQPIIIPLEPQRPAEAPPPPPSPVPVAPPQSGPTTDAPSTTPQGTAVAPDTATPPPSK